MQPRRAPVMRVMAHGDASAGHGHGHGHGATSTKEKGEKEKGFVNEMRKVAMKLHTKEQAPKEGQQEAPKRKEFNPTKESYLRFLVESKAVYDVMESIVHTSNHPEYAAFRNTGLERAGSLKEDLAWFNQHLGMEIPAPQPNGPGISYGEKIAELAEKDPQAFICHYYNFYFAHTAGGRMIGSKVAQMILDNQQLKFYQWDGDVAVYLDEVRRKINELAESWSEEQKEHCLAETKASFQYSGKILESIMN